MSNPAARARAHRSPLAPARSRSTAPRQQLRSTRDSRKTKSPADPPHRRSSSPPIARGQNRVARRPLPVTSRRTCRPRRTRLSSPPGSARASRRRSPRSPACRQGAGPPRRSTGHPRMTKLPVFGPRCRPGPRPPADPPHRRSSPPPSGQASLLCRCADGSGFCVELAGRAPGDRYCRRSRPRRGRVDRVGHRLGRRACAPRGSAGRPGVGRPQRPATRALGRAGSARRGWAYLVSRSGHGSGFRIAVAGRAPNGHIRRRTRPARADAKTRAHRPVARAHGRAG
jgi:hypothetical protein